MSLGFLAGMAQGAGKQLTEQDSEAFKLKLQNAQIEGQMKADEAKYERELVSAEGTAEIAPGVYPPGSQRSTGELGLVQKPKITSLGAAGRTGNTGMSRKQFNEIYQVQTPGGENDWLNNTEVITLRDRLRKEEPSVGLTAQYDTSVRSKNLIKELWGLRQSASDEGGIGMVRGFVARADRAVTGGKILPKSTAFMNARSAAATLFAKMYGDTGNIAWQEAERAVNSLGNERLSAEAAEIQYDSLIRILDTIEESALKSSAGLRRKVQREKDGTNMPSLTDKTKPLETIKKQVSRKDAILRHAKQLELEGGE